MKIVHIQSYYGDGFGYQENILPSYQSYMGHEVVVLTSVYNFGFSGSRRESAGEYRDNGFILKRLEVKGEFRDRFVIFKDLYGELERLEPDYIFHHSATSPSIGAVCEYKRNNPKTFTALDNHADLTISGRNALWRILYYQTYWRGYLKQKDPYINVYFGVTPSRCLFLEKQLGIEPKKIRLLPIGADTRELEKCKINRDDLFYKLGIESDKKIVVHGGKITPEKECAKLLDAFSRIKAPDWRLVLFGDISDNDVIGALKDDPRIVFAGWLDRENTLSLLKYSDIGVWNWRHTTLMEDSVAAGLPLLIRYYGSTCHLVSNSGMFLYEGSAREIYDRLSFMINNPAILSEMRQNAAVFAKKMSYDNIADESVAYLSDLSPKRLHLEFMSGARFDREYPSAPKKG